MTETNPFILLNLDGKDYKYRMTLNGIIELQQRTGVNLEDAEALTKKIQSDISFVRTIIWLGIKTYDKEITEEEIGDMIDTTNVGTIMEQIFKHVGMEEAGKAKNVQRVVTKKIPNRGTGKLPLKRPVKSASPPPSSTT